MYAKLATVEPCTDMAVGLREDPGDGVAPGLPAVGRPYNPGPERRERAQLRGAGERQSCVQRATCQALRLPRGSEHPDRLPLSCQGLPLATDNQERGYRSLVVQSMGPEQRRQSICWAFGE